MRAVLYILVALVLLSGVVADTSYHIIGNNDTDYNEGVGFFNAQTTGQSFASRSISIPRQAPLVGDLDGDGINEIVVLDGSNIELYQSKDLTILDAFLLNNITTNAYMILYDIDNDGFIEVIIASDRTSVISIVEYNGTFSLQNQLIMDSFDPSPGSQTLEVMLNCRASEECLIIASHSASTGGGSATMFAYGFNSTDISTGVSFGGFSPGGASTPQICLPQIRSMATQDYDTDNTIEFIFTSIGVANIVTPEEFLRIHYIDIDSSLVPNSELQIDKDLGDLIGSVTSCLNGPELITSPLVADLDGAVGNGLETAVGYNIDPDEFNMEIFDKNGGSIQEFPTLADADGKIISNVIFIQNEGFNACVIGYQDTLNRMNVLCSSLTDSIGLFDNLQYKFDAVPYNLSDTQHKYNVMGHSGAFSSINSPNIEELINSYGVFELDFDSCSAITGNCDINLIFDINNNFGKQDGAVIPIDVEKNGRDDLLMLTDTNLFYFDDGFSNTAGVIASYTINPCLDSTWQINTTVNIQMVVTDINLDNVAANTSLYTGLPNEQAEQSTNASTGTTFSFSYVANETVGSSILRLSGKDVQNFDSPDVIDLFFSVGTQGVQFGECVTQVDLTGTPGAADNTTSAGIRINNSLTNAVNDVSESFNLTPLLLWLILMFIVAGATFYQAISSSNWTGGEAIGGMLVIQAIMLVLGTALDFIPLGITITIVILLMVGIAVFLRTQLSKTTT